MFYVLLCLKEECYGLDILDRVPAMTDSRVSVGSGTLYNLLEQFLIEGMIVETKVEGRRRSYILTDKGKEMLEKEYQRIRAQALDYRRIFGKEEA
jgi:DNA-binding PadR family transcriptional regulator